MFSTGFRRLYYVCDKVIVRNLRGSRLPPNPGLQHRLNAFQRDGIKVDEEDAEEFVEQSDSDFFNVGQSYNEHVKETLKSKHQLAYHIVKEKYFKENIPNLLTWSEKEQIRHLATTSPEEWTPERIAESFPVTVEVVKKLLKYNWKPATEDRIARHDASAMRNWRDLKEGNLDIPENLKQHFLKFSERTIPPLNKKSIHIDLTQEKRLGEFESIIRRCAAKDEGQSAETDSFSTNIDSEDLTPKGKGKKDTKRTTLDELTAKIKKRIDKGKDVNVPDKMMLDIVTAEPPKVSPAEVGNEIEVVNEESSAKEVTQFKPDEKKLITVDYTKRIRIPKNAYKRGATYKVNDCYYDADGKFLYRVIGMTN